MKTTTLNRVTAREILFEKACINIKLHIPDLFRLQRQYLKLQLFKP